MKGIRRILVVALPLLAILAACTLKTGYCIAMSDCDDGMTCNEGLCQTPGDTALSADADADADANANASSIANDGGTTGASSRDSSTTTAVDAGVDAADSSTTDAPSDS